MLTEEYLEKGLIGLSRAHEAGHNEAIGVQQLLQPTIFQKI